MIIIISQKAHGDGDVDSDDLAWGYNSPLKTSVDMPLSCVLVLLNLSWPLTFLHIIYYIGVQLVAVQKYSEGPEWNAGLQNVNLSLNSSHITDKMCNLHYR